MKRNHLHSGLTAIAIMLFLCAVFVSSCASTPKEIEEGLNPAEYFQKAQAYMVERNDYKTALLYYQTFLERFPDDIQNRVAAEYEIAFIFYKTGDTEEAKRLFTELLAKYEGDGAMVLPRWPEVLAKKLLIKIDEPAQNTKQ